GAAHGLASLASTASPRSCTRRRGFKPGEPDATAIRAMDPSAHSSDDREEDPPHATLPDPRPAGDAALGLACDPELRTERGQVRLNARSSRSPTPARAHLGASTARSPSRAASTTSSRRSASSGTASIPTWRARTAAHAGLAASGRALPRCSRSSSSPWPDADARSHARSHARREPGCGLLCKSCVVGRFRSPPSDPSVQRFPYTDMMATVTGSDDPDVDCIVMPEVAMHLDARHFPVLIATWFGVPNPDIVLRYGEWLERMAALAAAEDTRLA